MKVGVFICGCGNEIAGVLDLVSIQEAVRDFPNTSFVRQMSYSCSRDGVASIEASILRENLDRIVIAGCPPRMMRRHFESAFDAMGMPRGIFELVDLREGCALVHADSPQGATAKAVDLIRMGVARSIHRRSTERVDVEISPAVLVIGGGVVGMTAALALADRGIRVKLVERENELGGLARHVLAVNLEGNELAQYVAQKTQAVISNPEIELLLGGEVAAVEGTPGQYEITIVEDATNRMKAFDVGAIIVATGARLEFPQDFPAPDGQDIVDPLGFDGELRCLRNGESTTGYPAQLVMLLCGDHRNSNHSSLDACWTRLLEQAYEVKTANPETKITVLLQDIDMYESQMADARLHQAEILGVEFRILPSSCVPRVADHEIVIEDDIADRIDHIQFDQLVLAAPMIPQHDASVLANMLRIDQDADGFFLQRRYRLRPETLGHRGVFVCGAAHKPSTFEDAELQATLTAFQVVRFINAGRTTWNESTAIVDGNVCTGCGMCVPHCPFAAITMERQETLLDRSRIDPLRCSGCGNCVVTCPVRAIDLPNENDAQLIAQIESAFVGKEDCEGRTLLVFGCEWSGQAAAEIAGVRRLSYSTDVRLIRLGCAARFDPMLALWAFLLGADGVFVGACAPGECHHLFGNRDALERFTRLQQQLDDSGFDRRRLRMEWVNPDDPQEFVAKIRKFNDLLRGLEPNHARLM